MTLSMDLLCKSYIKVRDAKRALTKEYDDKCADLDKHLALLAGAMKDRLIEQGGTSLKTEFGTVYLKTNARYYCTDWESFKNWAIENKALDLLEKRIAQGNMGQWLQENATNPPIGVHADSEVTAVVRKA